MQSKKCATMQELSIKIRLQNPKKQRIFAAIINVQIDIVMKMHKLLLGIVGMALLMPVFTACDPDKGPDNPSNEENKPLSQYNKPARNPYLAQETYSITHFNSAQTDAFPFAVKDGAYDVNIDDCTSTWSGPVNLMTLASTDPNYMWGMSSDRVSYIRVADGAFERVAEAALPQVPTKTQADLQALTADYASLADLDQAVRQVLGTMPQMAIANGNYVLCDHENYVYTNAGKILVRYCLKDKNDPTKGIRLVSQIDMTPYIGNSLTLVGVSMTYDGYLLVASQYGLASVDRNLSGVVDTYQFPEGQILSNSISNDENGGLYIASNSTTPEGKGVMQKVICKNGIFSNKAEDGAWQANYDGGPAAPAIKLGYGAGSTPTLMGFGDEEDKLVVITDGAKRMKLVAFWRDAIPADAVVVDAANPRLAGHFEVSCGLPAGREWIQSEQSVVAGGYDAFVVNNIHTEDVPHQDKVVGVLAIGPLIEAPMGAECVRWNVKENKWESKWVRNDVSSISMIPAVSTASEMVFVNGYYADGWDVQGLDWKTGATRHRIVFGKNNRGNGAYAILQYFPNGDLLFNSVSGPFRVKLQ